MENGADRTVRGLVNLGASATAVRVAANSPIPHTGSSYLFVRMRENETGSSLDWLWRKVKGLTPGKSYTFSFWFKTPSAAEMPQTGNIRLGAVINETDIPTLSNPLAPEVTFWICLRLPMEFLSSSDEHKKVSYTFTMPADKTDVYIVWRRNGHQQPFLDDMSLVMN